MTAPLQGLFFHDFKNAYFPEILKEIYRDQIYAPYFHGKKDLIILDIGANVGLFSFYAYEFAKKIYAVEPSQEHMVALKTMIKFNQMDDKIVPVRRALGHKDEITRFHHTENSTMFSLTPGAPSVSSEEVVVSTFPTLFKDLKLAYVDFVKLDIEGNEMNVLGGSAFDEVADKIGVIHGEFHAWTNTNPHQFEAAFTDRGFNFNWSHNTEASIFTAVNTRHK